MTVQATGARRLTLTRPELARDAFGAIETAGREALDELRRLLGVLRHDVRRGDAHPAAVAAPRPLADPPHERVRPARRAPDRGRGARAARRGRPHRLPRDRRRAHRRSRASAAPATPRCSLRYTPDAVVIEVRDDGPSASERELIGIRERVHLHGGQLSAGPRRSGGHRRPGHAAAGRRAGGGAGMRDDAGAPRRRGAAQTPHALAADVVRRRRHRGGARRRRGGRRGDRLRGPQRPARRQRARRPRLRTADRAAPPGAARRAADHVRLRLPDEPDADARRARCSCRSS